MEKIQRSRRNCTYGGAVKSGPGRHTHKGGHKQELMAAKKRARRLIRRSITREEY